MLQAGATGRREREIYNSLRRPVISGEMKEDEMGGR
jgi:hypothetical protein